MTYPSLKSLTEAYVDQSNEKLVPKLKDKRYSRALNLLFQKKIGFARGSRTNKEAFFVRTTHKDKRTPTGVDAVVDNYVESYRSKNFPNIPSRQKALFCYAVNLKKVPATTIYGTQYLILPDNRSKIFQSKNILDFFSSEVEDAIEDYLENYILPIENAEKALNDYFTHANITFDTISPGEKEVVIEYNSYLAISLQWLPDDLNRYIAAGNKPMSLIDYLKFLSKQ